MTAEFILVVSLPGTAEHFTRSFAGEVVAGRASGCGLHLPHPLVSREHASIRALEAGLFAVRDLGSKHGTTVNGTLLRDGEIEAEAGGVVQIGPFVVMLTDAGSDTADTVTLPRQAVGRRVTIDATLRTVLVDGKPVLERLSPLEYRFLEALASQPGVMNSTAVGDAAWGAGRWDVYMLHNLVRRVRKRFEEQGFQEELVINIPNVGYRLA